MTNRLALFYALSAYFIWGLVPIYWRQITEVAALEIVVHRTLWALVFILLYITVRQRWSMFIDLWRQPTVLWRSLLASITNAINWLMYIWAVINGHIIETSMGYFINPLITVLCGVILFSEKLRCTQWFALALVACGILFVIIDHGRIPYIALILSSSFACYSVLKKTLPATAVQGLGVETGLMVIPALLYLLYLNSQGQMAFGQDLRIDVLLIMGGLVTLAPLLLFAAAAKELSLTVLGMSQYVGPTLQLLIGVFIYNEIFDRTWAIAFAFIWSALVIYTIDQIQHETRRKRRIRQHATKFHG